MSLIQKKRCPRVWCLNVKMGSKFLPQIPFSLSLLLHVFVIKHRCLFDAIRVLCYCMNILYSLH